MGEARNVKEFGDIMVDHRAGQPIYRPIQLKEVARIEDGLADMRRISRVLGKPAVPIMHNMASNTNINISNLNAGIYLVSALDKKGNIYYSKFVKE